MLDAARKLLEPTYGQRSPPMARGIIYGEAEFAMASLLVISTKFTCFDTGVPDLVEQLASPREVSFGLAAPRSAQRSPTASRK